MLPPEFSVSVETIDGRAVVRVVGELDTATVDELREATRELAAEGRTVTYDLGGLSFIDSTGLNFFVQAHKAAQRDGFEFALRRPRPEVFRAFELTTLDKLLRWTE
jgi:anti-anti-sigma factor